MVNMVSLSYMIVYPFITFPANFVLDDYGLRVGMFFAAALTIIGLLLRILINQSFYWVIAGAIIGGIG
jgi:fucose permease